MIQYYNQISVNHYKREVDGSVTGSFRPVDVGWRFCRDELPDKIEPIMVKTESIYGIIPAYFEPKNKLWVSLITNEVLGDVVQWCKIPEPLKNDEQE